MESKVDKLDIDKLVPVPVDLSKLSDLVKSSVVKKDVYNAKMKNIEDKIPVTTNLTANASLNAKMGEVKGEMSSITNLATAVALTTVEKKVTYVVKKSRLWCKNNRNGKKSLLLLIIISSRVIHLMQR